MPQTTSGVVGVQFLLDGNNLVSEVTSSPYSVSWNTVTVGNGNHILTAVARDAAGNNATSSAITVNVNNDVTSPAVSITSPTGGNISGTITVTANASDNVGVTGVQFLLNGTNLGSEDLTAPYSISWNTTTLANNSYNISARARDAAGYTTMSVLGGSRCKQRHTGARCHCGCSHRVARRRYNQRHGNCKR